jgi:hypothetical protein
VSRLNFSLDLSTIALPHDIPRLMKKNRFSALEQDRLYRHILNSDACTHLVCRAFQESEFRFSYPRSSDGHPRPGQAAAKWTVNKSAKF